MLKFTTTSPALILTFAAIATGCSSNSDSQYDWSYNDPTYTYRNPKPELAIQNAIVNCKDTARCNPSVGMIGFVAGDDLVGQCSGFLVGPRTVMTNSHCIEQDVVSASDCGTKLQVAFPAQAGLARVNAKCSRVLHKSKINDFLGTPLSYNPDYAFFEIDRDVGRPALSVSHEGVAGGAKVRIDKVNPIRNYDGTAEGELESVECESVVNSIVMPGYRGAHDPIGLTGGCKVIGGNSGSPLLGADGKVHGIVFASLNKERIQSQLGSLVEGGEVGELSLFTNLSCTPDPNGARVGDVRVDAPKGCDVVLQAMKMDIYVAKLMTRLLDAEVAGLRDFADSRGALAKSHPQFGWGARLIQDSYGSYTQESGEIALLPVCGVARARWDKTRKFKFELPKVPAKLSYTRYLTPKFKIDAIHGDVVPTAVTLTDSEGTPDTGMLITAERTRGKNDYSKLMNPMRYESLALCPAASAK